MTQQDGFDDLTTGMIRELQDLQARLKQLSVSARTAGNQRVAIRVERALAAVILARLMLEGKI